jgi:predicted O-methyltransferase YrrM
MEVLQVDTELSLMLDLYRERQPARVLEIGCWDGGTLREWLTQHTPDIVVAVDLDHRNRGSYHEWTHRDTQLVVGVGQSQSTSMIELMRRNAPYDWVFIDGDHGDWGVMTDVATCVPLVRVGGLLLLHDIEAGSDFSGDYPPRLELRRLAVDRETWEYVDNEQMWPHAHGIGVVQL